MNNRHPKQCLVLAISAWILSAPFLGSVARSQQTVIEATAPKSEEEALRAVEAGATELNLRHLEPYRSDASRRLLERSLSNAGGDPGVRRVAAEVLVAQLVAHQDGPRSSDLENTVGAIAADAQWSRATRTSAMRALVDAYLRDDSSEAGRRVVEQAGPTLEGAVAAKDRGLVAQVLRRAIEQRPGTITELMAHAHPVVRDFASRQEKAWRREDPQMDYRDIALLLEWKAERIKTLEAKIELAEKHLKHSKPGDIHLFETPTAELERLRKTIAEARRAKVLDMAVRKLDWYYLSMAEIKAGRQRAEDRVERALTPRDRVYEFSSDQTEWRRMPSGEWNEVKVGESSFRIDLDELLGPLPAPTEKELAELGGPDQRHRGAIASAERAAESLFRLSPETVERALDGYVKWFNDEATKDYRERKKAARKGEYVQGASIINRERLIPLPPRP